MSPDAERIRERYARVVEEVGPGVQVIAATKYVALEEMAALAEAGVTVVGENRAQDLAAKHAVYGNAFRWHFIGHLQSRKAPALNATCELVHSLDSLSAARRLEIPALVQVNLSGEASKSGVSPEELESSSTRARQTYAACRRCRRCAADPEASRASFRRLRGLAERLGLRELSMGTSQDFRVAAKEGATLVRVGSHLWRE